ncbi:hypothetical protein ABIC74_001195 [Mucilaginibacter rubeus]
MKTELKYKFQLKYGFVLPMASVLMSFIEKMENLKKLIIDYCLHTLGNIFYYAFNQ